MGGAGTGYGGEDERREEKDRVGDTGKAEGRKVREGEKDKE